MKELCDTCKYEKGKCQHPKVREYWKQHHYLQQGTPKQEYHPCFDRWIIDQEPKWKLWCPKEDFLKEKEFEI